METITSSEDISSLFAHGKRIHTSALTLIFAPRLPNPSPSQGGRVAFVAGKKQGGAVWRNSAKRRMRALCREAGGPWDGMDVVFLAKKGIMEEPYGIVAKGLEKALRRIDLQVR